MAYWFWLLFLGGFNVCTAEAVSIKSAAARRRALLQYVIRVNSRSAATAYDSTINVVVCIFIIITTKRNSEVNKALTCSIEPIQSRMDSEDEAVSSSS